jgi:predicted dehydrogenase
VLRGITVGCGFFGNIHLEGWSRVENARIVAVVDQDEKKALETAERFGVRAYPNLAAAIERETPDFVDIATTPGSHLEIAEVVAARGCQVLCQKPIASTWEESVRLVETCQKHHVRLMINENWRWQPWYRHIKDLIQAEKIGQVESITIIRHEADALRTPPFADQPYFVDMERFLLVESVIHPLDVVRFLGGRIQAIFCDARRVSGVTRGEDSVYVHLYLQENARGMIYWTRCSEPDKEHPICDYARIEGSGGFIRLDRDGQITIKPLSEPAFQHRYAIPQVGYRGDSCRVALGHFVDCLLSNEPFETEGADYLDQVMRVIFAGYESARTRQVVSL